MSTEERKDTIIPSDEAANSDADSDAVVNAWLAPAEIRSQPTEDGKESNDLDTIAMNDDYLYGHKNGVAGTLRRIAAASAQNESQSHQTDDNDGKNEEEGTPKPKDPESEKQDNNDAPQPKPFKFNLRPKSPTPAPVPPTTDKNANSNDHSPSPSGTPDEKDPLSDEDRAFVDQLPDDLRDSIDFWQEAEAVDPQKYQGKLSAQLKYLRSYQFKLDELSKDDPDFDPATSDELRAWVDKQKNRPQAGRKEQAEIMRKKIQQDMDASTQKVRRETDSRLRRMEELPKAEATIDAFSESLSAELPDDITGTIQGAIESGGDMSAAITAVSEHYGPEVANAVSSIHDSATGTADAFVKTTRGLTAFDQHNRYHLDAINAVVDFGRVMMEDPKLAKVQTDSEGRTFLPREKYFDPKLTNEERAKHFTFSEAQVLDMLSARAKEQMKALIPEARKKAEERERRILAKYGYKPEKKKEASNDREDPPPSRMGGQRENDSPPIDDLASAFLRPMAKTD